MEKRERVLAIQVGSQEDVKLTIPALQKLRDLLPDAVITLMVSPSVKQLDETIPWIDDLLVYEDAESKFEDAKCELALIAKLRQCAIEAAVIFTNPGESPFALAYSCYLAGIPIRVGQSQEFGGGVLSEWVVNNTTKHNQEQFLTEQYFIDYHLLLVQHLQQNLEDRKQNSEGKKGFIHCF